MSKKLIISVTIIIIIFNALLPHYICATNAEQTTDASKNTETSQSTTTNGNTETSQGTTTNENTETSQSTTNGSSSVTKMESLEGQNARKEIKRENQGDVEKTQVSVTVDKSGGISQVGTKSPSEPGNYINAIAKIIIKMLCIIPYSLQLLMTLVTTPDNKQMIEGSNIVEQGKNTFDATKVNWFTIEKAVLGQIPLFDVNFFDVSTDGSNTNSKLKESVAQWYQVMYVLAQILSILVLIYIGIRMAMASNPEDKVNYKKMFKNWLIGFALLFLLHYGIIIILKLNTVLISLIPTSLLSKGYETKIITSMVDVWDSKESVWSVFLYFISYLTIVGFEAYFFWKYLKRLLIMGFLVIISPLITVTYAIDKADDGKAQAYTSWISLFISNTFMQAVQALMYAVFIFSAAQIAEKAPMIAIIFFMGILKGESMFNKLFNLGK